MIFLSVLRRILRRVRLRYFMCLRVNSLEPASMRHCIRISHDAIVSFNYLRTEREDSLLDFPTCYARLVPLCRGLTRRIACSASVGTEVLGHSTRVIIRECGRLWKSVFSMLSLLPQNHYNTSDTLCSSFGITSPSTRVDHTSSFEMFQL
jgi:hypothetical protein